MGQVLPLCKEFLYTNTVQQQWYSERLVKTKTVTVQVSGSQNLHPNLLFGWRGSIRLVILVIQKELNMAIEKKSTQTCSDCRKRTGPAACLGLGIIAWQCAGCGICHTQNQNSANNHRLVYKQLVILNYFVLKNEDSCFIGNSLRLLG